MFDVFVCDDNIDILKQMKRTIDNYLFENELDVKANYISCDFEIEIKKRQRKNKVNVYFLDIDLDNDDYNGVDLARKLRVDDLDCYIIFLTAYEKYVMETIQSKLRILDYILKQPHKAKSSFAKVIECLDIVVRELSKDDYAKQNLLYIKTKNEGYKLKKSELISVEKIKGTRNLLINMTDSQITINSTMQEFVKLLDDEFYQLNRSTIINLRKIQFSNLTVRENEIKLENGDVFQVPTRKVKELKELVDSIEYA